MSVLRGGRTVVLVDVENLLGSGLIALKDAAAIREVLWRLLDLPCDAQVVVATSCGATALDVGLAWPGARLLFRNGPDGADRCLLEVAEEERLAQRFAEVVIASGDAAFAPVAAQLSRQGARVTLVGRRGSTANVLRQQCDGYVEFPQLGEQDWVALAA